MNTAKTNDIYPDAGQPRKFFDKVKMGSLKRSIEKFGVLTPISVQKTKEGYMIVDGERRWRVAREMGVKELPINVLEDTDDLSRVIEQFHIQEQHEGWTSTEKASVIMGLAQKTGKSASDLCKLLGIDPRTAKEYIAFSKVMDKDAYDKAGVPVTHAAPINFLKQAFKNVSENVLGEEFTPTDMRKVEAEIIRLYSEGEFQNVRGYARIKDIIKNDPKTVREFLKGDVNLSKLYIKSNAKEAASFKNYMVALGYAYSHATEYVKNPAVVRVTAKDIGIIKTRVKSILQALEVAQSHEVE